jgi:hypothetical protein
MADRERFGFRVDARSGRAPPRAANAARLCLGALCFGAGNEAFAQGSDAPPRAAVLPQDWQRQQPTRERSRDLMREEGVLPSPEERREELRTLNELYRELVPSPGSVPAPGVVKEPGRPSD